MRRVGLPAQRRARQCDCHIGPVPQRAGVAVAALRSRAILETCAHDELIFVRRTGRRAELTHVVRGHVPSWHQGHTQGAINCCERAVQLRIHREIVAIVVHGLPEQQHEQRRDGRLPEPRVLRRMIWRLLGQVEARIQFPDAGALAAAARRAGAFEILGLDALGERLQLLFQLLIRIGRRGLRGARSDRSRRSRARSPRTCRFPDRHRSAAR